MAGERIDNEMINGATHEFFEIVLGLNHPKATLQTFPEEFIIKAWNKKGSAQKESLEFRSSALARLAQDANGAGAILIRIPRIDGDTSYWLGYRPFEGSKIEIAILERIKSDFEIVLWDSASPEERIKHKKEHPNVISVLSPISSPGKWQIAHGFAGKKNYPIIFLWRVESPAFFEIHSHLESNLCSPIPPALGHIWDTAEQKSGKKVPQFELGYKWQTRLAKQDFVLGEGGVIGSMPTSEIAKIFANQYLKSDLMEVFPFLCGNPDLFACLMPMDMEYMHYDGYKGIPIVKAFRQKKGKSDETEERLWHCWNKLWQIDPDRGDFSTFPNSEFGEIWEALSAEDQKWYEPWRTQIKAYKDSGKITTASQKSEGSEGYFPKSIKMMPFYKFDPRRYTAQANERSGEKWQMEDVFRQTIHGDSQEGCFFGFKLYTATGWAPMDPFLRDPLERFYSFSESKQVPIINHGGPAGYYTHDRKFYFELLLGDGKVCKGESDELTDGWTSKFSEKAMSPSGNYFTPGDEPSSRWWFVHHYVSPRAWAPIIKKFPKLKLCLAHFGDSDHLSDQKDSVRKMREPAPIKNLKFAVDMNDGKIIESRSHQFLIDLVNLIQPENRVFVDLSYVIFDETSCWEFISLFLWARRFKPILLERILWGTDWPLIATEPPVNPGGEGTMLYRYAKGFREFIPKMPHDFFFRACFLNPVQFLGIHQAKKVCPEHHGFLKLDWLDSMDESIFADYSCDKLLEFYKRNPSLAKKWQ